MKTGLVVFAFGSPSYIDSNLHLAAEALNIVFEKQIYNIFTQMDIDISIGDNVIKVDRVNEVVGNPPSTLSIAKQLLEWAKINDLEKIIILAATPHKWRCMRDVKYVFSECKIELVQYRGMDHIVNSVWFNKNSRQSRTRNKCSWWLREIVLRIIPVAIYKIVAR